MMPNNFVVTGQPGLPQSQPQPGPQPGMPNMSLDHSRIWQLQQHQQQQHRQQQQLGGFPGQQPNGGGNQMNSQMVADLIRRQQQQQQAQGMAQRGQMSFGPMSQLAANNNSPFQHDASQGLSNAQPHLGNASANPNYLQMQTMRQNNMFPSQPMSRQFNLMLQQNADNQNNTMVLLQRQMQQQQQQQQVSQQPLPQQLQHQQHQASMNAPQLPPGLFTGSMNPAASMSSNMPSNMQQPNQMVRQLMPQHNMSDASMHGQLPGASQQQRRPNLVEMQDKAQQLKNAIQETEGRVKALQAQQGGPLPAEHLAAEINKAQKEVEGRRQALARIMAIVRAMQGNHNVGVPGAVPLPNNLPNNFGKGMASSPGPSQRMPAQNPGQPGWMPQSASSPAFNNSPHAMAAAARMPNQQGPQISTPQLPPQIVASQQPNQQMQRSATTPMQVMNPGAGPHGTAQPQVNVQNLANNGMTFAANRLPGQIPHPIFSVNPLSREAFQKAFYEQWLPRQAAKDKSILRWEGRDIDLYQLHCEVFSAGSVKQVSQKDLWPVIGARMGYVHFPGEDGQPGRAGPALAGHLEHIYNEFLVDFDAQYLRQLIAHRTKMQMQAQMQKQAAGTSLENGIAPQTRPQGMTLADIDPKLLREIVSYANLSVPDMQQHGIAPEIIRIVEHFRDQLKATYDQQSTFSQNIQTAHARMSNQQHVMAPGGGPQRPGLNSAGNPMANAQQSGLSMANGMAPHGLGMASQAQQHAQQHHQMANGMPPAVSGQPQQLPMDANQQRGPMNANGLQNRPPSVQLQQALQLVKRLKEEHRNFSPTNQQLIQIPDAQRIEYDASFENLHRLVTDLDGKLPHFAVCMKEEVIRKLVLMINAVQQQRELLSGQGPRKYFMPLQSVKNMIHQVQQANFMFEAWLKGQLPGGAAARLSMTNSGQPPSGPSGSGMAAQAGQMPQMPPQHPRMPGPSNVPQPPVPQSVLSAHTPAASSPPAPPAHTPSATSPPFAASTPILKKPTPKPPAESSAPTPTHAANSPQTPQTPKTKPATAKKPAPKPRKASKVAAAASPAEPKIPTTPAAAPATPAASAPTPDASAGTKRPREEDASAPAAASTAAPASKKIKTEWDELPSDAALKRAAEAENIKTDDDAVKFFDQMTSWLSQMSGDCEGRDGSSSLQTIARELDDILQAYPGAPDDNGLPPGFIDGITVGSASPKLGGPTVDPSDYFDFISYELPDADPAGSKAATPDLVQGASSVGPSPGSASETDHPPASGPAAADTAKIVEPKTEPGEGADAIRPELWQAIDGGEAGFYNSSVGWKWEQPMGAVDQAWALSYQPS